MRRDKGQSDKRRGTAEDFQLARGAIFRYSSEIGEHTRTLLTELLGLTPVELDGLSGRGIIGPS